MQVRNRMILIIPSEYCSPARRVAGAVEHPLDVRARPAVDGRVTAIMTIVAQIRRDEGVRGQVAHVELAVGANFRVTQVVAAVGARAVHLRTKVVERRNVLGGVAAG
jgi:hypothetical protein